MTSFQVDSIYTSLASVMAANGMISNSSAAVIGGMLVAPYSNPLIAFSNQLLNTDAVAQEELAKLGAYMLISIVIGMVYYKIYNAYFEMNPELTVSDHDQSELEGRTAGSMGTYINAFIYALVAGITIAYTNIRLGGTNIAALLGCGIGASLLPPAVNCGIYLAKGNQTKALNAIKLTLVNVVAIFLGHQLTGRYLRA